MNSTMSPKTSLRPKYFRDLIGQRALIERLSISIRSAKARNQPMPHILFDAPPGLGKTTLAQCIANELHVSSFHATVAPMLSSIPAAIEFILKTHGPSVLFIDECHKLPTKIEEFLYPVLEDNVLEIEQGLPKLDLPPITFIGATTQSGELSKPFRDRFPLREQITFYTVKELAQLVRVNALKMNLEMEPNVPAYIAATSRGTPRIVNSRLSWLRDYAHSKKRYRISLDLVFDALESKGIDSKGLDNRDRQVLKTIRDVFNGGPVGVNSLASASSVSKQTIEDEIEPYLLYLGLIRRTAKGRELTDAGRKLL
jgi:Holliday junction DNA helicase RuvB